MKVKFILLSVLAILLLAVVDVYGNTQDDNEGYMTSRVDAIAYIQEEVPGLELTSYWELDDGHLFEGYLNGEPVEVYWLEAQDGEIEVHHKPR